MRCWKFWLGAAWIAFSAIYFYMRFGWVFYDANRNAIAEVLAPILH